MRPDKTTDYDAIVIGAGFSGIRSLWELGNLGLTAKCFEAGSDVGGAWYWNRYPGARTDSEAWVYTMNFAPGSREEWDYRERYPSQSDVQQYLGRIVDRFDLRKQISFNTRTKAAHYCDIENIWTITTADGNTTTCRYFLAATGPLSVAKKPPFAGVKSFTGKVYQTSSWPSENIDLHGKRIAIVGTGATGVQIIPKIAMVAEELTVFQRTPNYVLPGRNYTIDDSEAANIKKSYDDTWNRARAHPFGLAMNATGKTAKDVADAESTRQVLDAGWESGGFHFQFETLDDIFTNKESNDVASEYVRRKIHAIVKDQRVAYLLSPKYPFLSKRPPCGHFYYETYNRPNVKLVDISRDDISLYESGIRTASGTEYDFDVLIFALGFDAATGALSEMDVQGSNGKTLRETWSKNLETFAGVLLPGFPNMFVVCGPHVPFGNMPIVLDIEASWIGKTIRHMEENDLAKIEVSEGAVHEWTSHLDQAFKATLFAESAKASGAWFVGANIPGKASAPLFYFGGISTWTTWLDNECKTAWARMKFESRTVADAVDKDSSDQAIYSMAASNVASIA